MLDLRRGQLGPDHVCRRRFCHGKHASLDSWPPELLVNLGQGAMVVVMITVPLLRQRTHQMACCCRDLAPECFYTASLPIRYFDQLSKSRRTKLSREWQRSTYRQDGLVIPGGRIVVEAILVVIRGGHAYVCSPVRCARQ